MCIKLQYRLWKTSQHYVIPFFQFELPQTSSFNYIDSFTRYFTLCLLTRSYRSFLIGRLLYYVFLRGEKTQNLIQPRFFLVNEDFSIVVCLFELIIFSKNENNLLKIAFLNVFMKRCLVFYVKFNSILTYIIKLI